MTAWFLLLASWLPQVAPQQVASSSDPQSGFVLREVAAETGLTIVNLSGSNTHKIFIVEQLGSGAALFDYDLDGDLDLYVANGADVAIARGEAPPVHNALFRNEGGWYFEDVTERAGVGHIGWGIGVAAGDIDGDGDSDLYVTNYGPNVLYENLGDGTFRDVSAAAGVDDDGMGVSASFADLDEDGDLDLYVVNYVVLDLDNPPLNGKLCDYEGLKTACGPIGLEAQADRLYRNDGGLRFADVSVSSGVHEPDPQYGLGLAFGDYDDDGRVDIFVANDSGPNFLFHNQGIVADGPGQSSLRFEDMALLSGVATQSDGRYQAGMGVDFGDANGDGRTDLFVTNFSNDHNTLYLNQGGELFQDASHPSGLGGASRKPMGWGTHFYDFDNDGDQDLYVANGHIYPEVDIDGRQSFRQPDQLFLNDGHGRFEEASKRILRTKEVQVGRGVAGGDIDHDGDIDLVVLELASTPSLLRNEGSGHGSFAMLELRDRAVTGGMGARVWVTAAGKIQRREVTSGGSYCVASDPRLSFGLGAVDRIERVEIRWPREGRQVFRSLLPDRRYVIVE